MFNVVFNLFFSYLVHSLLFLIRKLQAVIAGIEYYLEYMQIYLTIATRLSRTEQKKSLSKINLINENVELKAKLKVSENNCMNLKRELITFEVMHSWRLNKELGQTSEFEFTPPHQVAVAYEMPLDKASG